MKKRAAHEQPLQSPIEVDTMARNKFAAMLLMVALANSIGHPVLADNSASNDGPESKTALLNSFSWAGGIEDTFLPQSKPGFRRLDEYELTQHYEQWRGDLDRAKSLGITKLRWGVPWYRVEPRRGAYDWKWTDEVLSYMVNNLHIEPIIDLVHYGTPTWMAESFLDPDYPDEVAKYASAFAKRYKDKVRYYTPLNEPGLTAEFSGRKGQWPPYLTGDTGYVRVLLPIARGIQKSAKKIRDADSDATLVAVEAMRYFTGQGPGSKSAAQYEFRKDMLPWDLVSGKVDKNHPLYSWLTSNGADAKQLQDLQENGITQDVLGVDFFPWSIQTVIEEANGKFVLSDGQSQGQLLLPLIRDCWNYAKTPMFITETSTAGDVSKRARWMSETIEAVRAARAEGLPVVGYTWFPLSTMIDWQYRVTRKPLAEYLNNVGLWDSKFDADGVLRRDETILVGGYRDWIKQGMPAAANVAAPETKEPESD